jgi:serine-aspartate repeat-containing protein C/D/E
MYTTGPTLCAAGDYTVEILSLPTGYVLAGPASQVVSITREPSGVLSKKGSVNFALSLEECTSSIGDRVWNDLNANGVQDPGEPGIAGVTVQLLNAGGAVIATKTTDANGNYTFIVACSNNYQVQVVPPTGFVASPTLQGGNVNTDSDTNPTLVTIGANEDRTDIDFGFYARCQGVIGDRVWHDLNRNGIQDAGEPGLYNVKIELLQGGVGGRATLTQATRGYHLNKD